MKKRIFKYYPEDFGELTVKVLHMDLFFDVFPQKTKVKSKFRAKTLNKPISKLEMDAKNLEISFVSCNIRDIEYSYESSKDKLIIKFKKPIPSNTNFIITTENITKPTNNVLEGLYYDETPKGCPPTQITQCQQWGFQRLVPCIDDMTAKCTYTTTITADSRYTNIITNGDISIKRHSISKGRDKIKYENIKTPMPPYLFFLGVGTYETFKKECEYPNGDKFMLELLVPPYSNKKSANRALDILYDCIMWIYLFTGKDEYKNSSKSKDILKLIRLRDKLKSKKKKLSQIRRKLKLLVKPLNLGYKYTGTVYREIAMQNSNFGGMENVGNTTITANRIMPFPDSLDSDFEYMTEVKLHEFYHNINGSEVTGWSPFELWLNEAVTVHIEKKYHSFLFGEDYSRLDTIIKFLDSRNGTFMQDESPSTLPIIPNGFNNPDELITSITYVKSPEFVRMIETLIGKEKFTKALDYYHKKYSHRNATGGNWLDAIKKVSGINFYNFSEMWLKKTGFPKVNVTEIYNKQKKTYTLSLAQTNNQKNNFWQFPFKVAIFTKEGKMISEKLELIKNKKQSIIFRNTKKPGFVSLNRGYSFYGKVFFNNNKDRLLLQVKKDNDIISKFMAFYYLIDNEKQRLLKNKSSSVSEHITNLYYELLNEDELIAKVGIQFLSIFEFVEDKKYAHNYKELYDVKKKIHTAIALKYKKELKRLYLKYSKLKFKGNYVEKKAAEIKNRQVKNLCLKLLSCLDNEDIHKIIKKQLNKNNNPTDRVTAFSLYMNSSAKDKFKILNFEEKAAKKSLVSWETFLRVISNNDSKDYLKIIKKVEKSKEFRIEQANDQRGLYYGFSYNKKKSLQTKEGRFYLKKILIKLAKINEYTTVGIIKIFGSIDLMEDKYHISLVDILVRLLNSLNLNETPSVYNTALMILKGIPKARKKYEKKFGKIKYLK